MTGWRKSTRSETQNACLEVTAEVPGWIGIRDTKLGARSPILVFTEVEWAAMLATASNGDFDRGDSDPGRRPARLRRSRPFGDHLRTAFDHRLINDQVDFHPTSELLAYHLGRWFIDNVEPGIHGWLVSVGVAETRLPSALWEWLDAP